MKNRTSGKGDGVPRCHVCDNPSHRCECAGLPGTVAWINSAEAAGLETCSTNNLAHIYHPEMERPMCGPKGLPKTTVPASPQDRVCFNCRDIPQKEHHRIRYEAQSNLSE